MTETARCDNCGAMMTPAFDGRVHACVYCGAKVQVAIGADQIAAGLALDLADIDAFLSQLANTLAQGLAERAKIEARGREVLAIEIDLEPNVFAVRREGKHATATHKKVVRGIALKTQTVPLDRWVEMLTDALATHANENARAAWVLAQLGGGRR